MSTQANKAIFWHRRDLRVIDNHGLFEANTAHKEVIPVFIFDTTILMQLVPDDSRVTFIYENISELAAKYQSHGNQLEVFFGDPTELIPALAKKWQVDAVFANEDYEPYAMQRDADVFEKLTQQTTLLRTFKDHVIFEKAEVMKDDGLPYTVFTPYMNKWKKRLLDNSWKEYESEATLKPRIFTQNEMPSVESMGFVLNKSISFPERKISKSIIKDYHATRDLPGILGTSRLSVHLRFGTLSIRKLANVARETNEKYFNELIWRDFYSMILFHFPQTVTSAFKKNYDLIPWLNNETEFNAWCEGKTGYPMVDAGMRELNETGFMHNRVRMIVASFLCKHLLIDWRWGERYFAKKLLDFDLASNIGGWQWAASSGCDAVPYFRIFNPISQQEKFDPKFEYIRKWLPEFGTSDYPAPIVDHAFARVRAIETFKKSLSEQK